MTTRGPEPPSLSVAVVAGAQRRRMQRMLHCLAGQTIAGQVEVIVVDTRPDASAWQLPAAPPVRVLPARSSTFGKAREAGVVAAQAELIAFLEDHCYPAPDWAEAVVSAFRGQVAAVGYAFENANPRSRNSRIAMLATYGEWVAPRGGGVTALPGNNVAYRREVLLAEGADLPAMLEADFNLHARLRRRGFTLSVESQARVAHENDESFLNALRSSFAYSRILATRRAAFEGWTRRRRLSYALGIIAGAPLVRLLGAVGGTWRRPKELGRLVVYSPAILGIYLTSAIGETFGYVCGAGNAAAQMAHWEVDAPRAPEP